jgi:hypothetical protein
MNHKSSYYLLLLVVPLLGVHRNSYDLIELGEDEDE